VSRAVWRAAFGTLRANRRLSFYYLFASFYTAQSCGLALRRGGVVPILLLAFWAFGWSVFSRIAPTHRELLRLPLSTRDAAAVLFVLRVLVPCACVLLLIPLVGQLFAPGPDAPRALLALACGLCAAFPLLVFAPFLPLPRNWREVGVTRESGEDRQLHWLAAVGLCVLAPAIAVIPLVAERLGFLEWPWVSLVLGMGLASFTWIQRERLARAALRTAANAVQDAARGNGARWNGWSGFVPLVSPLVGTCCVFGLAIGLFFTIPLMPGAVTTMVITLISLSTAFSARYIVNCARVLRLLPISPTRLSLILLSMLVLPTLIGCLIGATLAHVLHPERLSIERVELLCLLSLTCNVVVFVAALRGGRLKSIGPQLAASALVQVASVLAALYFGIAAPPEAWVFAACLGALILCQGWLTANLKFHRVRPLAALAITLLSCLPVFGAGAADVSRCAVGAAPAQGVQTRSPLSNTMRHVFGASRRQTELNLPTILPLTTTTPVLRARSPDGSTSTASGAQENGASLSLNNGRQASAICVTPRSTPALLKNTASCDKKRRKALKSRSAIDCANAVSVAKTCCCAVGGVGLTRGGAGERVLAPLAQAANSHSAAPSSAVNRSTRSKSWGYMLTSAYKRRQTRVANAS
jgi:hypothetical protein